MTKPVKKHEFLFPVPRLFTRGEDNACDSIPVRFSESFGDESTPALTSPTTWDSETAAAISPAACKAVPADLRAIEENTVPSWLWRHQSRNARRMVESDVRDIFNRATGSAAAKAWKLGLFTSEKHARAFYDESRYALMQRYIALAPEAIGSWGLSWAYGIDEPKRQKKSHKQQQSASLTNAAIDGLTGQGKNGASTPLWKKLFAARGKEISTVHVQFSDIAADWHSPAPCPARAAIDLLALRHNDGTVNIDALRHAARLLTILLDLQDCADVTIGLANLAPLLLALGLAYDSHAARAMAASLAALVTAECYAASAEMAALRGPSDAFSANREAIMRSLRNHRRAVYGDGNDYEKLSVSPSALPLRNCPDLALVAEAQRRWNEVLELARAFGLRATQATDLTPSPALSLLMGCASQGLEPMRCLTTLRQDEADLYRVLIHPAVGEALTRLDYARSTAEAAAQHIGGARSLRKAPAINHATLRAQGLDDTALEKIEAYLPCVDTVRLAVTPWIIGVDFCRTQLKIPARTLESPRFDLLRHLGFADADCDAANLYCYGHGTLRNARILHLRHRSVFACGAEISVDARLRMAAAAQSFISGDTGVTAHVSAKQSVERGAELALSAWRSGLKSLTFVFDPAIAAQPARKAPGTARRIKAAAQPHAKPMPSLPRKPQSRKDAPPVLVAKKPPNARRVSHKA